jgi:exonuclease SbcC
VTDSTHVVDADADRRTLAQAALRVLGERCPVCDQKYDREATRRRLERLASSSSAPVSTSTRRQDRAAKLDEQIAALERQRQAAEAAFHEVRRQASELRLRELEKERLARDAEVIVEPGVSMKAAVAELAKSLSNKIASLDTQAEQGEKLALQLAQAAERARHAQVEREAAVLREKLQAIETTVKARRATGELAARIIEQLRDGASDVVTTRLEQIEPLLQRIYARTDPHPAFQVVRFFTHVTRGRGHLSTAIEDALAELSTDTPAAILSSSQMNALAVAVFLSFNLGLPKLPLRLAMLDDPLQSLEEVNLLGSIDLLRRTKDRRQLFVSTHDSRFGKLLELKLRPIGEGQRSRVIELDAWTRQGPTVRQRDIAADLTPLRIVA